MFVKKNFLSLSLSVSLLPL